MKTELFPLCAVAIVDFCTFTRLSTLGKSALALRPRCSTWCLTRDRQTFGYPRKAAPHFPPPVVSIGALGCKTRSAANDCLFMKLKQMTMTNKQFKLNSLILRLINHHFQIFLFHPAVALLVSQRLFYCRKKNPR